MDGCLLTQLVTDEKDFPPVLPPRASTFVPAFRKDRAGMNNRRPAGWFGGNISDIRNHDQSTTSWPQERNGAAAGWIDTDHGALAA
jgi:hypothetical protein